MRAIVASVSLLIDNMKHRILIMVLIPMCLIGCQDIAPVEKPENLIPENKMEEILYEALLIKAALGFNAGKLTATGIDPQNYVLDKFEIDSTIFAANIAYYAAQNERYTAMNTRIQERLVAMFVIEDSLEKIETKIQDSLRLERTKENEAERMARMKEDSIHGITRDTKSPSRNFMRNSVVFPKDSL